uniref:Uncharacterized protein n=1 Tax=Rhizophora mucronata TaxID=61149 RepID=A0A2P2Q136_RHIMU
MPWADRPKMYEASQKFFYHKQFIIDLQQDNYKVNVG